MSNKSDGSRFERDFATTLASMYGFWVHNLAANKQGQPFDIIAVKDGISYAIDCKTCASGDFKLDRIEPNQLSAFALWQRCGNGNAYLALQLTEGVYMLRFSAAKMMLDRGDKTIKKDTILLMAEPLSEWTVSL